MGWFRATLPPAPGPAPSLHFDGADDKGMVYLNGQKAGAHTDYGESFDVPLDAAWNPAGPNALTVLVENDGGPGGLDDVYLKCAVGVRSLRWDANTGFALNGKPFKIR